MAVIVAGILTRRINISRMVVLTVLLLLFSLAAFAGRWHWLADLLTHFVPHYLAAATGLLAGLLLTRRHAWAALALALAVWNGWLLGPFLIPHGNAALEDGTKLDLLQFNMSSTNPAPLATVGYILGLEDPPDVIVLFETTPEFATSLKILNEVYPTIAQMPRRDNFGMSVLSRLPASEVEFEESGAPGVPLLVLRARVAGETVRIYAVHPPPPLGSALSAARNAQLAELARAIAREDRGHVIVAGDLNATPWSRALDPLTTSAGLRDAQREAGYLPTWAPLRLWRWLGLPIDLTLVSPEIAVAERRAGPWLGSDHWPVHSRLIVGRAD